jgi:hypothetical protein
MLPTGNDDETTRRNGASAMRVMGAKVALRVITNVGAQDRLNYKR